MPAVSTLYIRPSRNTRGDFFPLFGTIELNSLYQLLILLFGPSSFAIFLDILVRTIRTFMLGWELKNWRARIIRSQCFRDSVAALSVGILPFRAL